MSTAIHLWLAFRKKEKNGPEWPPPPTYCVPLGIISYNMQHSPTLYDAFIRFSVAGNHRVSLSVHGRWGDDSSAATYASISTVQHMYGMVRYGTVQ